MMSNTGKLVIAAIIGIVGLILVVVGVIYATVPIHSLPGMIPGGHPGGGHYHKRAAITGLIGVVLLVIAGGVVMLARRSPTAPPASNVATPNAAESDSGAVSI
jgi:hypothetical protein